MSAVFYRICKDGHVYPADIISPRKTIYYIETCLLPERTTRSGWQYYTSYLQDSKRQRVPDNLLEWNGVRCHLNERDGWTSDKDKKDFGINGIVLVASITDALGKECRVLFDNNRHDGQAWKQLMEYIRDVQSLGSHRDVEEARRLR
jgi:hypothetical protein